MAEYINDCPRCGVKKTSFDLLRTVQVGLQYDWQRVVEAFCICRHCGRSTVFVLFQKEVPFKTFFEAGLHTYKGSVNNLVKGHGHISLKDSAGVEPPDYIPENIERVFREGAACLAINCFNAAGTMFRLCVDLTTKGMLPEEEADGLNRSVRRSLGLRLPWLIDNRYIPEALRGLSTCIKDDGNDGAHEGNLSKEDVEDLLDFTHVLLERIYTEPKRIELAKERRDARRNPDT